MKENIMKRKPENPITKIRTGTGDSGRTNFQGCNISKDDPILEFVGDLDEACSSIACIRFLISSPFEKYLKRSIVLLFEIGAMAHSKAAYEKHHNRLNDYVIDVETFMEEYIAENELTPLKGFIIPDVFNANIMVARAIVRRAERSAVSGKYNWAVPAINILSDFLFLVAWSRSTFSDQWTGFNNE